MKKEIRISGNLKQLIEEHISERAKLHSQAKKVDALMANITRINFDENHVNIYWLFDHHGRIRKIYWNEGLTDKEREELEKENSWALEQFSKEFA